MFTVIVAMVNVIVMMATKVSTAVFRQITAVVLLALKGLVFHYSTLTGKANSFSFYGVNI